jgi:hypothetical protein
VLRIEECEGTEGGVGDLELSLIWSEWLEIIATKHDLVATGLWTKSWLKHCDLRVIVIPVVHALLRELLAIE